MQITEITIHPTNEDLVRAYVSIVFDTCFMVGEIRVMQGPTGKGLLIFCDTQDQYRLRGSEKDCRGWLPMQSLSSGKVKHGGTGDKLRKSTVLGP
jgi:SpoVG